MECKDFDQYVIKVDGTGRLTLRNRKFLRKLLPIQRKPVPTRQESMKPIIIPDKPIPTYPPQGQEPSDTPTLESHPPHTHTPDIESPQPLADIPVEAPVPVGYQTAGTPPLWSQSVPSPHYTSPATPEPTDPLTDHPPSVPLPPIHSVPTTPETNARPTRARRPNMRYKEDEWDLGTMVEDSAARMVINLFHSLASRLGYQKSQP